MANAWGDQEDWISHFLVKYYYFSNFYRDRWFFPENLKKATKVKKTYKKYSDFLAQTLRSSVILFLARFRKSEYFL